MDLKLLLINLNKAKNSTDMDDFLWGVENIADSLAAIYDIGLIQYTLNALDSDYGDFCRCSCMACSLLTMFVTNYLCMNIGFNF